MELRERKNRSGATSYFIDYRQDGHRRRVVLKRITTAKDADIAFAAFKVQLSKEAAGLPTKQGATVGECIRGFVESKEGLVTEGHRALLDKWGREIIGHFGEGLPVRSLAEEAVAGYRRALKRKDDTRQGRNGAQTAGTINKKVAMLKAALDRAVKQGWIGKNPLAGIENISDARGPQWRYLTAEEVERLIDLFEEGVKVKRERSNGRNYETRWRPSLRLYRLVLFLLNTGARLGEAKALTWRDVDLKRGLVRLNTTKHAAKGRAAKSRYVPMNAALQELFEGLEQGGGGVFPYPNNAGRDFETWCEKAGLGHVRIHDLRHTFASGLAMAGVPLNTIRELLGHTTMTMTLRYAHLSPNATAEAVQTVNFGAKRKVAKVVSVAKAGA